MIPPAEGGRAGTPEATAEEVAERGRHHVDGYVIPGQGPAGDAAVFEREQEEDPVRGISGAGLRLAEERLPGPQIGVPERETAGVPLLRLHLEPGQDLFGKIGAAHPLELAG